MPFKCIGCDKVAQTVEEQSCKCQTPNFIKCEVVHLMHPQGTGRLIARKKRSVGIPTEEPRVEEQPLNICCGNMERIPIVTSITTIITCPDCLEFLASLQEE